MTHNHSHTHPPVRTDPRRRNALLLIGVAAFLCWASFSGRVGHCVAPRYAWMTPFGALFIAVMGIAGVGRRHDGHGHAHGAGDECDSAEHTACDCKAHGVGSPGQVWLSRAILVAPFILAAIVDPTRLSAEGVRKRQVPATSRSGAARDDLARAADWVFGVKARDRTTADGADEAVGSLDLSNATVRDVVTWTQQGLAGNLDGKFVSLIGQAEEQDDDLRFGLVRVVVTCCIADAMAVSVDVQPMPGTSVRRGQWVQVSGILRAPHNAPTPFLKASSVEEIPEPDYPYL